jgi:hypothetical protein
MRKAACRKYRHLRPYLGVLRYALLILLLLLLLLLSIKISEVPKSRSLVLFRMELILRARCH